MVHHPISACRRVRSPPLFLCSLRSIRVRGLINLDPNCRRSPTWRRYTSSASTRSGSSRSTSHPSPTSSGSLSGHLPFNSLSNSCHFRT
jgi:hypothetical protein